MRFIGYNHIDGIWYCVYQISGVDEYGYFVDREYVEWK